MKVGIIVTAREQSNRVKEKVLQFIDDEQTIDILLDHLKGFETILAIPAETGQLKLIHSVEGRAIFYRGEDESPMHRLYEAGRHAGFDHVVRITVDDILIDAGLLQQQIDFHVKNGLDYTYMGRCPTGIAGEVISMQALKIICEDNPEPVEFISYYLKDRRFNWKEFYPPKEYQHIFRVCLDYPEDLTLLRIIFSILGPDFGTLDLINLYKTNPTLWEINKLPEITYYTCNYNYGRYIGQAIDSVVNQENLENAEYIILDDASYDNSCNVILDLVSSYPAYIQDKIKILRNEKNIGLPASSNRCLDLARGKYVMRIDSDDYIDKTLTSQLLETMRAEETDGCRSGYYREHAEVLESHVHPGCALLKTRYVQELRYNESLQFEEGTEFFERFEKRYQMSFLPEALWTYRPHPESKTSRRTTA